MSPAGEARGRDPGSPDARTVAPGAFDRIAVHGAFRVKLEIADEAIIALRGPSTMLDDTDLHVRDGQLLIRWQEGASWSHNGDDHGVDIDITLPALKEVTIGDSGSIDIDRIEGDRFTAMLFSSGGITIDEMDVKKLEVVQSGVGGLTIERLTADAVDVNLSGAGAMRANGSAATAKLMIFGAGSFDNPQFVARDATVIVGGSGGVRAAVTHHADIRSFGSGEINLTGGSTCTVSRNSGPVHQ